MASAFKKGVVYQATVVQKHTNQKDTYVGITENEFKTRYNQHTSSFRLLHKNSTITLSEHIICGILKITTSNTAYHGRLLKTTTSTAPRRRSAPFAPPKKYFIWTGNQLSTKRGRFSLNAHTGKKKHLGPLDKSMAYYKTWNVDSLSRETMRWLVGIFLYHDGNFPAAVASVNILACFCNRVQNLCFSPHYRLNWK